MVRHALLERAWSLKRPERARGGRLISPASDCRKEHSRQAGGLSAPRGGNPRRRAACRGVGKYPPAEPGALGLEPLEAAGPCCINPHSYSHCAMPPQEPSVLLGHPYLTFWETVHLQSCGFTSRGYPVGGTPFVRLVAHCLESRPRTEGADFGICQTFAASPAEPGELPCWFSVPLSRGGMRTLVDIGTLQFSRRSPTDYTPVHCRVPASLWRRSLPRRPHAQRRQCVQGSVRLNEKLSA